MSTLKEKLLQAANELEKEAFNYPKIRTMDVVNTILRKLANSSNDEKIADDYAIEFAEWCLNYTPENIVTSNELLEIFKKENGYA